MTPSRDWLVYGAYGYTGRLVVQRALELGERPILAGRDAARVRELADEFGLEHRVAALDDHDALVAALAGVSAVAHCAGPFSATAEPMVSACLEAGVHYVDISGEIAALEAVFARDADARAAEVAVVLGAGFDVVPSDCLAALVAADLPEATQLELAFRAGGGVSRGTARAAIEGMSAMSLCRVEGAIVDAPRERRRLQLEFGGRAMTGTAVSWGDVSTAWRSTGISTIYVYTAVPAVVAASARASSALARVRVAGAVARRAMTAATRLLPNPSDETRRRTGTELWARATAPDGRTATRRMTTPNTYALTADAVVRVAQALTAGRVAPGVHSPSQGLGAHFAESLDGVTVTT